MSGPKLSLQYYSFIDLLSAPTSLITVFSNFISKPIMGLNVVDIDSEGDVLFIVSNDSANSEVTNEHVAPIISVEANHDDAEFVRNKASTPSDETATAVSGR